MTSIARSLAVALSFVVLSSPPLIQSWLDGDTRPFIVATLLLLGVQAFLFWSWDRDRPADARRDGTQSVAANVTSVASGFSRTIVIASAVLAAGWLLTSACHAWLHQIFTIPHDPQRADMLIVVQEGLRRVAQGRNPYTIYHVPWDAPLPYGPMLWGPYAIPMTLRADVRFLTVAGELFVPVACAMASIAAAARGRLAACAGCLAMLGAMCLNPDLERFASIGHTPAYWPLLALLAWLVARERWPAAAATLGVLVVARTTMVAMVPVLGIAVWQRARPQAARAAAFLVLAIALPFLPFALWDARALAYALYGSYQHVIKGFVWTSTTWAQHTIGVTGVLVSHGLQRFVDGIQIAVMFAVYALAWRAVRRGLSPVAWMGLALLAFSLTTLWPVTYVYFDVLLLLAAAVAIDQLPSGQRGLLSTAGCWTATAMATVLLVIGGAIVMLPAYPIVDAGEADARPYLRSGFGADERGDGRTFAWVEGRRASVLLPRRTAGPAAIDIICQPALSRGADSQQMSALLNGSFVGDVTMTAGWNQLLFVPPPGAWRIGVNELVLSLARVNDDRRQLSIERVAVRPVE